MLLKCCALHRCQNRSIELSADRIHERFEPLPDNRIPKIRKAAPIYVRAYAKSLAAIAAGYEAGEISKKEAAMYARNAELLLAMGIANTSHVLLVQVQSFFDAIFAVLKGAINDALQIPLL